MEKKNLKRAIAKFEELANDEKYEGNRKIINLDAFLKSDIKKKKKKKDNILESTPIKSNKTDLDKDQLNNTFNEDDSSSSEIKTADEFLKKFISQPSLVESSSKKDKSTSSVKNKSTSSTKNKSISSAKNKSTSSVKNKSTSSAKNNSLTKLKEKSLNKSPIKSKKSFSPSKTSILDKQRNRLDDDTKRYQELKEREQNFLMKFQNANQKTFDDEELSDEELDDEEFSDEELEDEELDDEELDDEEFSDEELEDNKPNRSINKTSKPISLLVKSPNNKKSLPSKTSTLNKQKTHLNKRDNQLDSKLKYYQKLSEREKQFLLNLQNDPKETIDEELSNEDEEFCDEENINEIDNLNDESFDDESIDPENSELFLEEQHHQQQQQRHQQQHHHYDQHHQHHQQQQQHHYDQQLTNDEDITDEERYKNNQIINLMNKNQYKQVCNLNKLNKTTIHQSTSSNHYDKMDYITNFDYQRTATEELYELILKSEESSFIVLSKLIKNIKKTLDQDELPNPSNVKPFFHFTPDNQIHITFLFINPKEIYYNPWNSIIAKNYSNLNILFEKIYQVIFNFNCIINKKHLKSTRI